MNRPMEIIKVIYWMDQKREHQKELTLNVRTGLDFREKVEVAHEHLLLKIGYYWEMKVKEVL